MGSAAAGFVENKQKYQSNEYNKDLGLNWMDFHNRQYDPQLGRFLSIDPLAEATADVSPYVAMDNDPANQVDPLGLQPEPSHTEYNLPTPRPQSLSTYFRRYNIKITQMHRGTLTMKQKTKLFMLLRWIGWRKEIWSKNQKQLVQIIRQVPKVMKLFGMV